jgi:putative mRNA 3-end processing factor
MAEPLLKFTSSSIYCPAANVHIDPWKPVEKAIITHAHSDHARFGCKHYLAHKDSEAILKLRLGETISLQTVEYGETFMINGVKFSLHPAGHIIGSAQVRVENNNQVWVASGDYKLQDDGFCPPFEPLKCNVFITESTFGLPIYKWDPQKQVIDEIKEWIKQNIIQEKTSVLMGYALGKMQRLIANLLPLETNVFAHGAIYNVNERLREAGFNLPHIPLVTRETPKEQLKRALVFAPSSALNSPWMKKFEPYSAGYCSGWMAIRGAKNRLAIDRGFVLSDHADWNELNSAIEETGAEKVYVTHGYTDTFSQWLREKGIDSAEVKTMYGEEEEIIKDETIL